VGRLEEVECPNNFTKTLSEPLALLHGPFFKVGAGGESSSHSNHFWTASDLAPVSIHDLFISFFSIY
jgi:hypothetical protein